MTHFNNGAAGAPGASPSAPFGAPERHEQPSCGPWQGVRRAHTPLSPEASESSGPSAPAGGPWSPRVAPPPRSPFRFWQQQGRIPYAIEASSFAASYRRVFKQEPHRCPQRKQSRAYGLWELETCVRDCRLRHLCSMATDWGHGGRMRTALLHAITDPRFRRVLEEHTCFIPDALWSDPWWPLGTVEVAVRLQMQGVVVGQTWRLEEALRSLGFHGVAVSVSAWRPASHQEAGR